MLAVHYHLNRTIKHKYSIYHNYSLSFFPPHECRLKYWFLTLDTVVAPLVFTDTYCIPRQMFHWLMVSVVKACGKSNRLSTIRMKSYRLSSWLAHEEISIVQSDGIQNNFATNQNLMEIPQIFFSPYYIGFWIIHFINERKKMFDVKENLWLRSTVETSGNDNRIKTNFTVFFHEIWAMGPACVCMLL